MPRGRPGATEAQRRARARRRPGAARGRAARPRAAASGGERAATYEEARKPVESAALDELASRDRELLEELLRGFDDAYREAKARESASTSRISSCARATCCATGTRCATKALALPSVLVDEFQDTNRLQCELVDALDAEELFFVGDEFQSIYRFRHADVDVFRERRAQSDGVLALTQNYRSRPEILGVINHLFGPSSAPTTSLWWPRASSPDPAGTPRRAARDRQGGVHGRQDALARGASRSTSRAA